MFNAPPASAPVSPVSIILAEAAANGALVLCVGAGLSMADDASLPSGAKLADQLNGRFAGVSGYKAPENTSDLIAVADAAEGQQGGGEALRYEVLKLAKFTRAIPNYGHQATALLLAEGATMVLSWNWDTCIERALPEGEGLQVAKTAEDMAQLMRPQLAKVHGCATMPPSLLITSEHLKQPPPWANNTFADRLRASAIVFIGIGDVADYAQRRITEMIEDLRVVDLRVVSPIIRSKWDGSVWKKVAPQLADPDDDRRFEEYGDEFLDDLARGWVRELFNQAAVLSEGLKPEVAAALETVVDALSSRSAIEVMRWCRSATAMPRSGVSAVRSTATLNAVLATAMLAAQGGKAVAVPRRACCRVGDDEVEVLIVDELTPASDVRREAERRVSLLVTNDQLRAAGDVRFLVIGTTIGELSDPPDIGPGVGDDADIFDGPLARRPTFIAAAPLLKDAA